MEKGTKVILGVGIAGIAGLLYQRRRTRTRLSLDLLPENVEGNIVKDKSIYGNDGLIVGAQITPDGFLFSEGNYIDCGNDPSLNITDDIVLEAEIATTNAYGIVLAKGREHECYNLYIYNGQMGADIMTEFGTFYVIAGPLITDGMLHRIRVTYNKSVPENNLRAYLDRSLVGSVTAMGTVLVDDSRLFIGFREYSPYYFDGLIRKVKVEGI